MSWPGVHSTKKRLSQARWKTGLFSCLYSCAFAHVPLHSHRRACKHMNIHAYKPKKTKRRKQHCHCDSLILPLISLPPPPRLLGPWASGPEDRRLPVAMTTGDCCHLPGSLCDCSSSPAFSKVVEATGLGPPQYVAQVTSRDGRLLSTVIRALDAPR